MAKIIKRINSTGRRRIAKENISIKICNDGDFRSFHAEINLDSYRFPGNARVVLDVFSAGSTLSKRFSFGTIERRETPNGSLEEIEAENIFFTLKIIDQSERFGRILGVAENIRPNGSSRKKSLGRQGLLPVEAAELDCLLWKLDVRESGVFLLVNKKIPDFTFRFNTPEYAALLYPEILRVVLERAVAANVDENDDGWQRQWIRLGQSLHPEQIMPPESDAPMAQSTRK